MTTESKTTGLAPEAKEASEVREESASIDAIAVTARLAKSFAQAGLAIEPARALGWRPPQEAKPKQCEAFVSKRGADNVLLVEGATFKKRTLLSAEEAADALFYSNARTTGELRRASGSAWQCLVLDGSYDDTQQREVELALEWRSDDGRQRLFCRWQSATPLSWEATQALLFESVGLAAPTSWEIVETFDDR